MEQIVKDGIIDPSKYGQNGNKVLFILKEAVVRKKGLKDLSKYLLQPDEKCAHSPTWKNVAIWSYLLRHYNNPSKNLKWSEVQKKKTNRYQNIEKIAVININKRGNHIDETNTTSTDDKNLLSNFCKSQDDQNAILRQIEECEPEIVLCGGKVVGDCISYIYKDIKWKKYTNNDIQGRYAKYNNIIFIQYYHPQYYGKTRKKLYEGLCKILELATSL